MNRRRGSSRIGRPVALDSLNLIGFVTGGLGLGVATRSTVRLLAARGVGAVVTDVDPGVGRLGKDLTYAEAGQRPADPEQEPVTIFHVNPPEVTTVARTLTPSQRRADRFRAVVPFWELSVVDQGWLPALRGMDVILCPTRFVRDAVHAALPDAVLVDYPQTVEVPTALAPDRGFWGIPEETVLFTFGFDPASDAERKNPMATVRAFQLAFPTRRDVTLAIKASGLDQWADEPQVRDLLLAAREDERILLLSGWAPYDKVFGLLAAADVLVSLHRAEGLGLGMMEAMAAGTPVIATGYSGNTDFMNESNSVSIGFTLVPVNSRHLSYAHLNGRAVWADPDVDEAAAAMARLADDPALRKRLGEAGRQTMLERERAWASGAMLDDLAAALNSPEVRSRHRARLRAFRRASRPPFRIPPPRDWRHLAAVAVKGRLGLPI